MPSPSRVKDEVQMPSLFAMKDFGARSVKRRRVTAGGRNSRQQSKGRSVENDKYAAL